jgi:hypothetical protein
MSSSSELSRIGPASRIQLLSAFLVARMAVWLPWASRETVDRILSISCSAGTHRLTSPMRSASRPSMKSAVIR